MAEGQGQRFDVVVVGAGIAGLSCAAALGRDGARVVVLEQARGVGGRCATWRSDAGLALDYGATFVHAADAKLCAELADVPASALVRGWPDRIRGRGTACQPRAFWPQEQRLAYSDGLTAWPKRLAAGLDVRLRTKAVGFAHEPGAVRVRVESGDELW